MATQQFDRSRQSSSNTNPLRDARSQAEDFMQSATDSASEFYDQATEWVQDNYGKSIAIVGVLAAVGFLGFMLGKRSGSDLSNL